MNLNNTNILISGSVVENLSNQQRLYFQLERHYYRYLNHHTSEVDTTAKNLLKQLVEQHNLYDDDSDFKVKGDAFKNACYRAGVDLNTFNTVKVSTTFKNYIGSISEKDLDVTNRFIKEQREANLKKKKLKLDWLDLNIKDPKTYIVCEQKAEKIVRFCTVSNEEGQKIDYSRIETYGIDLDTLFDLVTELPQKEYAKNSTLVKLGLATGYLKTETPIEDWYSYDNTPYEYPTPIFKVEKTKNETSNIRHNK